MHLLGVAQRGLDQDSVRKKPLKTLSRILELISPVQLLGRRPALFVAQPRIDGVIRPGTLEPLAETEMRLLHEARLFQDPA